MESMDPAEARLQQSYRAYETDFREQWLKARHYRQSAWQALNELEKLSETWGEVAARLARLEELEKLLAGDPKRTVELQKLRRAHLQWFEQAGVDLDARCSERPTSGPDWVGFYLHRLDQLGRELDEIPTRYRDGLGFLKVAESDYQRTLEGR